MAEFMNDEDNKDIETLLEQYRQMQGPLIDQEIAESDKMQQPEIPLVPATPPPANEPSVAAQPEISSRPDLSKFEQLLSAYHNQTKQNDPMAEAIAARNQTDLNAGMLLGGSQIAQAIAAGYGGKIGANEEGVGLIQKMGTQKVQDIKDAQKLESDRLKLLLKASQPNNQMEWIATDRVLPNGHPVKFNRRTGQYADGITGDPVASDVATPRDIARRDLLTGQYGLMTGGGMVIKPTDYSAVSGKPSPKSEERRKPIEYGEFMRAAPEQAKVMEKNREQLLKDMQESREVATSITNLESKLSKGIDASSLYKDVDSGLLGGIQTQAAKMAGQKGVLTDQDLVKFAGAGGVPAAINRLFMNAQGKMTDADIKFFKRFTKLMSKSLDQDIKNRSEFFVDTGLQTAQGIMPGVQREDVSRWLGVDKIAPKVQDKMPGEGEVRRQTKDGRIAIFDAKTKKFLRYEQ
jgi:hypothetical protein